MSNSDQKVIVAADGGGTGCRAAAGTLDQGILGRASGGPGNVQSDWDSAIANVIGTIAAALAEAGLADVPLDRITAHVGVAGVHSEDEMAAVAKVLPYGHAFASGDRATSVRGALGQSDGYVLALGTGTIIARQKDLQMTTVGGWGFDLSDQASGAWLGRRLLQEILLAEDGVFPHTYLSKAVLEQKGGRVAMIHFAGDAGPADYAPLARDVIGKAKEGDAIGQRLLAEGAAFLERALKTLSFVEGDLLALAGGVGPHYADVLPSYMTRNLIQPKGTALDGAFDMACAAARGS